MPTTAARQVVRSKDPANRPRRRMASARRTEVCAIKNSPPVASRSEARTNVIDIREPMAHPILRPQATAAQHLPPLVAFEWQSKVGCTKISSARSRTRPA